LTGPIRELWSSEDEDAAGRLVAAVTSDDLMSALLAIEGASIASRAAVLAEIGRLGERVRTLLAGGATPQEALTQVVAIERGVSGDEEDYYHPDNSHLARVLERGRGLPILVSSLWVLVGRSAGLEVDGVALPGHFVARVGDAVVDPFAGGVPLSEADCVRIVRSFGPDRPWDPRWLDPTPIAVVVERVLRNLVNAFHQRDDRPHLYRATRLLALVAPSDPAVQLQLAQLTEEFGAYALAARLYQTIAATFEGRREAQIAAIRAVELASRSRTLN
jgi:regulator of sirC expression with transglutaminase-like and TPR domain